MPPLISVEVFFFLWSVFIDIYFYYIIIAHYIML